MRPIPVEALPVEAKTVKAKTGAAHSVEAIPVGAISVEAMMTPGVFSLPRFALGAVSRRTNPDLMTWALVAAVRELGTAAQTFASQACFSGCEDLGQLTGQSSRHLDSWLMGPDVCRDLFVYGSSRADLSIVYGMYREPESRSEPGGDLSQLAEWLDLPRIVVVNVRQISECQLPRQLHRADAVLLDMAEADQWGRWKTTIESIYGVPVLGWLPELSAVRSIFGQRRSGEAPTAELCQFLGSELLRHLDGRRLGDLSRSRPWDDPRPSELFQTNLSCSDRLTIALAYDEAFGAYFPDTLDLLEDRGAELHVFSPLRSEGLPAQAQVVYFGCGRPEMYAADLAANRCLHNALHLHLASGGRIYAECAGLAYLCREISLPGRRSYPMAGLLPATARLNCQAGPPESTIPGCQAQERQLLRNSWLGETGTSIRGYLNPRWSVTAEEPGWNLAAGPAAEIDIMGRGAIVGSRMHLHFASQPQLLQQFFLPSDPRRSWSLV